MPAGLQVWGPDGSLWVDTTTFLGRVYGVNTVTPAGDLTVNMAGLGTPFAIWPTPQYDSFSDNNGNSFSAPMCAGMTFINSNNTLRITFGFSGNGNPSALCFYGAF